MKRQLFWVYSFNLLWQIPVVGRCLAQNSGAVAPPQTSFDKSRVPPTGDIFDIKAPILFETGMDVLGWLLIAAVVAALAVAGSILWKKYKKKNESLAPTISPDEAALLKLSEIRHLMDGNGKKFYFRLSLILREYFFDQFEIGAPEMTTEEMIPQLVQLNLDPTVERNIRGFLYTGDLVKFAKVPSVRDDMEAHFKMVRQLIKETSEIMHGDLETSGSNNQSDGTADSNSEKDEGP